jgi:hypothetical protein
MVNVRHNECLPIFRQSYSLNPKLQVRRTHPGTGWDAANRPRLLHDAVRLARRDGLAGFQRLRPGAAAGRNHCKGRQRCTSCIGGWFLHNMNLLFHFTLYRSTKRVTWVTGR